MMMTRASQALGQSTQRSIIKENARWTILLQSFQVYTQHTVIYTRSLIINVCQIATGERKTKLDYWFSYNSPAKESSIETAMIQIH